MRCPIRPEHKMVEVAEGLFQCPHCGYGPSQYGHHPFWAISMVEKTPEGAMDAISVRWDSQHDYYVMSALSWCVDGAGKKITGTFAEGDSIILSTKQEIEEAPLPVIIRAKGKWDYPPAKPVLTPGMCPERLGEKEISLQSARRGRS